MGKHIWSQSADHKNDAKWLQDLLSEVNVKKQEMIDITTGSSIKILGRMPNMKSMNFSSLHERVRLQLKECLDSGFVPGWKLLTVVIADQIYAHWIKRSCYQKSRNGAGKVLQELTIYSILIGQ